MSNIGIFDINSTAVGGTWYNQTATGDIPSPRIDFCMVIVSAPDKSSHNMYVSRFNLSYNHGHTKLIHKATYMAVGTALITLTKFTFSQYPPSGGLRSLKGKRNAAPIPVMLSVTGNS